MLRRGFLLKFGIGLIGVGSILRLKSFFPKEVKLVRSITSNQENFHEKFGTSLNQWGKMDAHKILLNHMSVQGKVISIERKSQTNGYRVEIVFNSIDALKNYSAQFNKMTDLKYLEKSGILIKEEIFYI